MRFVMRSRQYTAALRADNGRLVLSTLAYADEIVPVDEVEDLAGLDTVDVSDREVKMAEMLVESPTPTFATECRDLRRTLSPPRAGPRRPPAHRPPQSRGRVALTACRLRTPLHRGDHLGCEPQLFPVRARSHFAVGVRRRSGAATVAAGDSTTRGAAIWQA